MIRNRRGVRALLYFVREDSLSFTLLQIVVNANSGRHVSKHECIEFCGRRFRRFKSPQVCLRGCMANHQIMVAPPCDLNVVADCDWCPRPFLHCCQVMSGFGKCSTIRHALALPSDLLRILVSLSPGEEQPLGAVDVLKSIGHGDFRFRKVKGGGFGDARTWLAELVDKSRFERCLARSSAAPPNI